MKVIYADKLIDALGLWGCYKHECPEACDTLMKYEVLQAIEDQYDDEESKCEELAEYIEVSLNHSDMGDDEVWFSREKREEILRELKKVEELTKGIEDLKDTLKDAYTLNDFVLNEAIVGKPLTEAESIAESFSLKAMQNLSWLLAVIEGSDEE